MDTAGQGRRQVSKKSKDGNPRPSDSPGRSTRKELQRLQAELVQIQEWVKASGAKIVVIFEGRDAAGKGGVIKRITERVSPRVFRVVALPAPTEREKTQWYGQRYIAHLPAAGEVVIFDRSWYNRAGVERVMGFCTEQEVERFLNTVPAFEENFAAAGIQLIKYWLTVDHDIQRKRFQDRIDDPRKHWKLSPMDLESPRRWYDYSRARDAMFEATDTPAAPWHIVRSDDKRRARLNCMNHLIDAIPYEPVPHEAPVLPARNEDDAYDDVGALAGRKFVPELY